MEEFAKSLNMSIKETADYVRIIGRVLADNFLQDVFNNKMTMEAAITESVKLWDKKQKDMAMQLLTGRVGENSYGMPKMKAFAEISLDYVYESLRAVLKAAERSTSKYIANC